MSARKAITRSGLDLKVARVRAGLRQYTVAFKVGIAPSRLSEIENGRREVSAELFRRILEIVKPSHDIDKGGNRICGEGTRQSFSKNKK